MRVSRCPPRAATSSVAHGNPSSTRRLNERLGGDSRGIIPGIYRGLGPYAAILLTDAPSEIDALKTQVEDAQGRIDTLETDATESQSGLTDARALAGQRGSRLMHGVAYMDVAMATLTLGSIDAGTELESVAELSKPLVKLGQENPAYEDLTLRLLRATDPEQSQRIFWTWLSYTLEQTKEALDESEPGDE